MRYVVVERLGRGGMGVVDLGHGPDGRPVALKRVSLHGSAIAMNQARQRLRREAEVLRSLQHPNIVGLLDVVDDHEHDEIVLVMPYLPGGSLSDAVATGGPLRPQQVDAAARSLLPALAAAHRQGVVHRDIKPANILFDARGEAHLADFGVASTRDVTVGLTGTDLVIGTPGFMAPEQARGEPASPASDVFSLGATLRWALTAEGPYGGGEAVAILQRAATGRVTPLSRTVPADLRRLLDAMCDPDPRRRPTAAALSGGPDGTAVHTAPRAARRSRRRVGALAAALVVVVGATAAFAATRPEEPAESRSAPTTSTAPPCEDRPYQPCGAPPAPGTDGDRCLPGFDDYDDDPSNGCEAEADDVPDGTALDPGEVVEANLVPRDDVDTWRYEVGDGFQLFCNGAVEVRFTAPAGGAQRLEARLGDEVVTSASSADATPVDLRVPDPDCFRDNSGSLELVVSPVGDGARASRVAEPYALEVRGSF